MSNFACMEDWDLQAVVRGCTNNEAPTTTLLANTKSCVGPLSTEQDHDLFNFPGILETRTVLDELEGLYKPFYQPLCPQTILACSSISVPKEVKQPQQRQTIKESAAKHKRSRKNQQNRVVQQVKAEGLGSDMWAWRKYGQKPIKGSPYPRSYYRCSSSKGCSARKQVERSCLDPGVFIVTYSSEHNHTHPTRRNSLAGSTRIKFSTPKREEEEVYSPNPTKVLSPTTPLMESIEKQCVQSANVKKEEEKMVQDSEGTENAMPHDNLILDNELFPSLEDFDELALEPTLDGCFLDNFLDTLF